MMTGLSCLTFVLVAFCCYALSSSKPTRNETTAKKLDLSENQQQATHQRSDDVGIHSEHELKTETRHKRSQLDLGSNGGVFGAGAGEYKDFNEFLGELDDNALLQTSIIPQSQEAIDLDNMSPLVYYMLLQQIKQMQNNERQLPTRRTPRLGRSIDFQLFDAAAAGAGSGANSSPLTSRDFEAGNAVANDYAGISRQFLPHIMKKSVQFKPRLGKRTQVCD